MVGTRIGRCGWHPFEVGEHIRLTDELLPVGRLVGTENRRVVLGTEPCPTLVRGDGQDIVYPLVERP